MASSDMTIDKLQIKIESEASKATDGIDALAESMGKLKTAIGDSDGLASNLTQISAAIKSFSGVGRINIKSSVSQLSQLKDLIPILGGAEAAQLAQNLKEISSALQTYSTIPKVSLTTFANGIKKLNEATASFDEKRMAEFAVQMQGIANGLSALNGLGKNNVSSTINAIKKIPEITESLKPEVIAEFGAKMQELVGIMTPLAEQMEKIGLGFAALPRSIQKAIRAGDKVVDSNGKMRTSYRGLGNSLAHTAARFWTLYYSAQRVVDIFADAFNTSNEYIEALNLFKVTMGETSDEALAYAKVVNEALGIDIAEWITNQGVFQRMATGFGIVQEQADVMSKNLTQLAYDLSSFFNTDVETAMQKLQSGMSGQIKGLKAWGYNLSVASLQETALSLGIEQSVRSMTEAQKAQLRYITLIQKSKGIMGDMAKTINTPSNAMRILSAQFTQFQRAVGNAISVIVTRWIPYIQAFVEVMTEAAASLAVNWGFEIEDLPTNNLDMAADVIEGINDGVDDTIDNVAKLKKQLMGFDELNILKSGDTNDASEVSYDLGFDMPTYDFLAGLDSEIGEKVDKIKKQIEGLIPLAKTLGGILLTAFAVSTFNNARDSLIKFFAATEAGKTIALSSAAAMDLFSGVLKTTKNPLKALGASIKTLWGGFKTMMQNLSPVTKGLISIIGLAVEFNTVKTSVKGFVDGSKSLGDALGAIIPVCGAVGVAMYAMLGPWGLVAAVVVGVVGAIAGFVEAENEMRKQIVASTFYDDYGKTLSDLSTEFDDLLTSSTAAYDGIIERQTDILTAETNIKNTADSVDTLVFQVESGATKIADAIPTIVDSFKTLYEDTTGYLTSTADLIYSALAGNVGKALEDLGIDIQGVASSTGKVTDEALAAINALNEKNSSLAKDYEAGLISDESYYDQLVANIAEIQKWSGVTAETDTAINDAKKSLASLFAEGINWDSDNLYGELEGFVAAADGAKDTIKEAYGSIVSALDEQIRLAKLEGKDFTIFEEAIVGVKASMQAELNGVDNMLTGALYALQEDLAYGAEDAFNKAIEGWDNLSGWKKAFVYGGDVDKYASAMVADYQEELAPIVEELKKVFGDDAVWVDDIVDDAGKATFRKGLAWSGATNSWFVGSVMKTDDFGAELKTAMQNAGIESTNGLLAGLSSEQQTVYNEARAMGLSVLEAYDEALDIHSPSKKMEDRGKYTIQGLVNGLTDNMVWLDAVITNIVGKFDILSTLQNLWKSVTDWWKTLSLPKIELKMPHFEWTSQPVDGWIADVLRTIGLEPALPKLNVEWYASGGFPTMGQMFIAREAGPELVGRIGNKNAVVNNDQIITGIATAVYNAMMAAQEDGESGSGGNAKIIVQIGDQAVGEASVRYINGKIVQTGTSPIYS